MKNNGDRTYTIHEDDLIVLFSALLAVPNEDVIQMGVPYGWDMSNEDVDVTFAKAHDVLITLPEK